MRSTHGSWFQACISVAVLGLVSGCVTPPGSSGGHARSGTDPCAPHGKLRGPHPAAVASTRTSDGQVIDWIPAASQTPDGVLAKPPSSAPIADSSPVAAPVTALEQGPPGTVPVLRSPYPQCECHAGYAAQGNGSCASIADTCVREGGMASAKSFSRCCPDLVASESLTLVDGACTMAAPLANVCTRCGNGICGPVENSCNCPADCGPVQGVH
ncbi:MAG TPA: hypothetical protein VJV79_13030 [Polyangiaceae bacterium]|nr:hypothetical protein [Polyangiaceae bacterium]